MAVESSAYLAAAVVTSTGSNDGDNASQEASQNSFLSYLQDQASAGGNGEELHRVKLARKII